METKLLLLVFCAGSVVLVEGSRETRWGEDVTIELVVDVINFSSRYSSRPRVVALVCSDAGPVRVWRGLSAARVAATVLDGRRGRGAAEAAAERLAAAADVRRRLHHGGPPDLFVLDLSCPDAAPFLRKADSLGLLADPNRWLLIDGIEELKGATASMLEDLSRVTTDKIKNDGFFDEENEVNEQTFNLHNMTVVMTSLPETSLRNKRNSLVSCDSGNQVATKDGSILEASLWEHRLGLSGALPDSQVLLASVRASAPEARGGVAVEACARLLELHRHARGRALLATAVGEWRSGGGMSWRAAPALSERRRDLGGLTLNASMVIINPDTLNHLDDLENKHIDSITKVNYHLTNYAFEMMNASVEYLYVDSWGYPDANGTWSGMVGHLQSGEAEVGATALFFTENRLGIIDYIALTTPTRAAFVFRQPPLSLVSNLFTLPFRTDVWVASSVLLALAGIMLLLAVRWEVIRLYSSSPSPSPAIRTPSPSTTTNPGPAPAPRTAFVFTGRLSSKLRAPSPQRGPDPGQLQPKWSDVVMLIIGAVCQQGSPAESRGVSGRIVSFMLFVFVIFLYTSYSANIVALLQSSTSSIRTLSDLLHSRLDVGVHDIVYNRHYFQVADDPVRKALYQKKVAPSGSSQKFMDLDEGFARVRRGLFAFHSELSSGYHVVQNTFSEDEKCGLQEITFLQVVDPYWALKKNSPYKELFRVAFRKMLERGVQSRTLRRIYTKRPECSGKGSSFVSVGLIECYPVLLVLAYGLGLSAAMLVGERILRRRSSTSVQKFVT